MQKFSGVTQALGALSLLVCHVGCGDRPAELDAAFQPAYAPDSAESDATDPTRASGNLLVRGLTGSIAMLDPALNQALLFTSPSKLRLTTTRLPVGRDVAQFKSSVARDRLFVLSRGVTPRYQASDEEPQLLVLDGGIAPRQLAKYTLQDPYDQLEADPLGEWLIVHGSEGLVSNPNELILVKLPKTGEDTGGAQTSKTLNSYGGKPQHFVFTNKLAVPGGESRRLLIVQREKDLAVIDLEDLDAPEITVGLPQNAEGGYESPSEVVFHEGIPGEVNAMLAVRLAEDSNVFILPLLEPKDDEHAFSLGANLVDVGGQPTQLAFVRTSKEGGLRLAALVPSKKAAKLIDPSSSKVTEVALPVGFSKIRLITSDVAASSGQDVALLYGESTKTIAFWQLGITVGTPYRSIDSYDLGINVGQVFDVPGARFADRKILAGSATGTNQQFYVLDLSQRKSFPLDALTNLTLNLSPNGQQLWAFQLGSTGFAQLTFEPLQPSSLYTERSIAFVHDFATQRGEAERSVMALHVLASQGHSSLAATLFDGDDPNTANTKFFSGLELAGMQ